MIISNEMAIGYSIGKDRVTKVFCTEYEGSTHYKFKFSSNLVVQFDIMDSTFDSYEDSKIRLIFDTLEKVYKELSPSFQKPLGQEEPKPVEKPTKFVISNRSKLNWDLETIPRENVKMADIMWDNMSSSNNEDKEEKLNDSLARFKDILEDE
jgi:hypothetical protein